MRKQYPSFVSNILSTVGHTLFLYKLYTLDKLNHTYVSIFSNCSHWFPFLCGVLGPLFTSLLIICLLTPTVFPVTTVANLSLIYLLKIKDWVSIILVFLISNIFRLYLYVVFCSLLVLRHQFFRTSSDILSYFFRVSICTVFATLGQALCNINIH